MELTPFIAIIAVSYTHLDVYKRQGYRRAKVVIRSLKVIGIQYQEAPAQKDEPAELAEDETPADLSLIHI